MQTERRLTKEDERRFMVEHARERQEQEQSRPQEQRHADFDWVSRYWKAVAL